MTGTATLAVHMPANASTALAAVPDGSKVEALLSHPEARARIGPLLSPGDDYERIVAVIGRASRQNPEILECKGTSILDAAATIVGWRLEIGETAYLVPFRDNDAGVKVCTPIMGYTGMAQLLQASGAVRFVEPWCVYANEPFEIFGGSESRIEHRPIAVADRGELRGAYVVVHLKFGARAFKWMPIEEIDAIRTTKSKRWKRGPCPPWYAMKTVIRQMAKLLPKTREVAKAFAFIQEEERAELGEEEAIELSAPLAPAAIAPAAVPAKPAEPPPLTLELALETPLRGRADKWNGNGGKKLRDVPPSIVRGARDWYAKLLAEAIAKESGFRDPALERFIAALGLVHALRLDEAERDQTKLFEDAAKEDEAVAEESEAERLTKFAATAPTPSAAPRIVKPIPADLAELKRWSTADLQATALDTLKNPAFEGSRQGHMMEINAGLTHVRAVAIVGELATGLANTPAAEKARRAGRIGDLPGDPA